MEESPAGQQHDQLLSDDEDTVEFEIEVVTSSASSVTSRASTPKRGDVDDRTTGPTCEWNQKHICGQQQVIEEQQSRETQITLTNEQPSRDEAKVTSKPETEDEKEKRLSLEQEVKTNILVGDVSSSQSIDHRPSPSEESLAPETNEEIVNNELAVGSSLQVQEGQHVNGANKVIPLEQGDPQHDDERKSVIEQSSVVEPVPHQDLSEDAEQANMASLEVDCQADLKSAPSCIFESGCQIEANAVEQPAQLSDRALTLDSISLQTASANQETSIDHEHARVGERLPPASKSDCISLSTAPTSDSSDYACDWQLVVERIQWPTGWSLIDAIVNSNDQVQLSAPLETKPAKPKERPSIIQQTTAGQSELAPSDVNGREKSFVGADSLAKLDSQINSNEADDQNKPLSRDTSEIREHVDSVATIQEAPQQEQCIGDVSVQLEGVPTVMVRSDASESPQSSIGVGAAELEGLVAAKSETSGSSQHGDEFQAGSDGDHDDNGSNVHAYSFGSNQHFNKLVLHKLSSSSSLHLLNSEAGSVNFDDEDLEREFDEEPEFQRRNVQVKRNRNPRDEYEPGAELGRGKFGTVVRCTELSSGLKLAAKFIHLRRREDREDVEREVAIMSVLQHKRLLQLYDAFDDGHQEMCLITELVEGGELFERIVDDDFDLTEKKAAIFMRQICEGVEYMHSEHIVHLDMKPENILCLSRTGIRIKLIDFGLARRLDPQNPIRVLFGTPDFAAPEVLGYEIVTLATDMWSVGVICYVLLSGLSPFMGDSDIDTMANVMRATYDFNDQAFEAISDLAKDFISKLLVRDPATRLKPSECLKHAWLQRGGAPLEAQIRDRRESSFSLVLGAHHRLALDQAAMLTSHVAATTTATTSTTNSTEPTPPTPPSQFSAGSGAAPGLLAGLMSRVSFGAESNASVGNQSLDKRRLKKYVVRRKWHKTVHAIMALGRMGANLKLA